MKTKEEMKEIYLRDVKESAEYSMRDCLKNNKAVDYKTAWDLDTRLFSKAIILQDLEILTYEETCEWLREARLLSKEITGYELKPNWTDEAYL